MSEFSDKLSEYIAKSGSNVYQLAKEASLDRTTLQKTAKGQRLPSLDYIREICQYIKISSKQEEELVRLYKIEKLGHSTVKAWDEIQKIILDIYKKSNDFVIDIKNTSINNPLVDNPNFNTTKEDCGHGFGMRSIMNIVNKYYGEITYDYSYRYFSVQIRIKS